MKRSRHILPILTAMLVAALAACSGNGTQEGQVTFEDSSSVRLERKHIQAGNELFEQKKFDDAEIEYRKALEANPASAIATFNLATSLLYMGNERTMATADSLLDVIEREVEHDGLLSLAHYDRGNTQYLAEQWQAAIDFYKKALRKNPDDDWARYNLRMAQLKLQKQQNQQQPQGGGGDNNDQQDQKNDQQKQNQQQQQDQQQDKDQNPNNNDKNEQQQQQAQPQQSSDQALNAVQQKENETKRRVGQRLNEQNNERRERTRKKW